MNEFFCILFLISFCTEAETFSFFLSQSPFILPFPCVIILPNSSQLALPMMVPGWNFFQNTFAKPLISITLETLVEINTNNVNSQRRINACMNHSTTQLHSFVTLCILPLCGPAQVESHLGNIEQSNMESFKSQAGSPLLFLTLLLRSSPWRINVSDDLSIRSFPQFTTHQVGCFAFATFLWS